MKVILNKTALLIFILIFTSNILAQNVWGPEQTDYRRDLRKYQSNTVISDGLGSLSTQYIIGHESGPLLRRAVYQWNIPENEIPDNSEITLVRLTFSYSKLGAISELPANFYKISYDMIGEDNFDEMFAEMNYTVQELGYQLGSNNQITFSSSNSNAPFNQAIKNALPQNKFILGIKWDNDLSSFNYTWGITNSSVNLYIEYTPPQQSVTLDQRLSNNTPVGKYSVPQKLDKKID